MDFYLVLGLTPGASYADVKRAYRRLSRRYHPGINPGDGAAQAMYERISEAYETLIDPERRRAYDAAGSRPAEGVSARLEFAGFDFSAAARGAEASTFTELFADVLHPTRQPGAPEAGPDLHASLTVPFEDAMRGVAREVVVTTETECGVCTGLGHVQAREARCAPCHGTGRTRWVRGHMVFMRNCAECHGTGHQRTVRCAVCAGHGRIVRTDAVPVSVPPGVRDGAQIRIAGRGHHGRHGGRPGDLYVTVTVPPHPVFRRDGDDIHVVLPIGVHEAVLGARIDAPSLEGPIKLRIPPGTAAGQRLRLRDRGAPTAAGGRGDLIVEVRLVLPTLLDERGKDLIREFARLYPDGPRPTTSW
jgi:molecular chaperone DnaJ